MTQAEKFKFEMMSTPELANECQLLKVDMRYHQNEKKRCKDGADEKAYAFHTREYRKAKMMKKKIEDILSSRQMKMF